MERSQSSQSLTALMATATKLLPVKVVLRIGVVVLVAIRFVTGRVGRSHHVVLGLVNGRVGRNHRVVLGLVTGCWLVQLRRVSLHRLYSCVRRKRVRCVVIYAGKNSLLQPPYDAMQTYGNTPRSSLKLFAFTITTSDVSFISYKPKSAHCYMEEEVASMC